MASEFSAIVTTLTSLLVCTWRTEEALILVKLTDPEDVDEEDFVLSVD